MTIGSIGDVLPKNLPNDYPLYEGPMPQQMRTSIHPNQVIFGNDTEYELVYYACKLDDLVTQRRSNEGGMGVKGAQAAGATEYNIASLSHGIDNIIQYSVPAGKYRTVDMPKDGTMVHGQMLLAVFLREDASMTFLKKERLNKGRMYVVRSKMISNRDDVAENRLSIDTPTSMVKAFLDHQSDAFVAARADAFVDGRDMWIAKETQSGKDRLDYERYAMALAGLLRTDKLDILPTAIGIYAPWGYGKSFLLELLKKELMENLDAKDKGEILQRCECISPVLLRIWRSAFVVILRVMLASLLKWLLNTFCPRGITSAVARGSNVGHSSPDIEEENDQAYREIMVVEFNAWECAESDVIWASLITKIFDNVEGHEKFGRGLVRATRLRKLLLGREWNCFGLVSFYLIVAVLGLMLVILINVAGLVAGAVNVGQWATAVLGLPGFLTFLRVLSQLRTTGFLRTSQTVLQDAASKKESVGASYRGFMAEVKEELEILFELVNEHNAAKQPGQRAHTLAIIVDDLDRCPKQQIVSILEAMHLLLEQQKAPIAIFLAVDPRLVISAVAEVLGEETNEVTALEYLDKIIHIPFCLPRISERDQRNYLDALLDGDDNSCLKTLERLKRRTDTPHATGTGLSYTLKEFPENTRTIINGIEAATQLLDIVHRWKHPEVTKAYSSFKDKLKSVKTNSKIERCLEKLNGELNQILFTEDNEAASSEERKNDGVTGGQNPVPPEPPTIPSQNEAGVVITSASSHSVSSVRSSQSQGIPHSRAISTDEKNVFKNIFPSVIATPRKMKRVVNVYLLQRSLFLGALEQQRVPTGDLEYLRRALVTWTILAELWPMRLSWVIHEMEASGDSDKEKTITGFYGDKDLDSSPCALIHAILGQKDLKDLYLSDAHEEGFTKVVKNGEMITKNMVLRPGGLLEHSFNLNPTIVTLVENIKRTGI